MEQLLVYLQAYGVAAVALAVFAKRMGVPVPALPFLLLAGARGAQEPWFAWLAVAAAAGAGILADALWFEAGRRHGRAVLAIACRISVSPGSCIQRSELAFARHGGAAVLLGKFVPGLAGLAPPMAGALGMPAGRFFGLNAAGTLLWTASGVAAGILFHREVKLLLDTLQRMGSAALPLVLGAFAVYIGWRGVHRIVAAKRARGAAALDAGQRATGARVDAAQ